MALCRATPPDRAPGPHDRWASLTPREKAVVAALLAGGLLFGPRLLVLGAVAAERAALGAALAVEAALGAAFLASFTTLAAVALFLLAGGLVYFLALEEERLDGGDGDEE